MSPRPTAARHQHHTAGGGRPGPGRFDQTEQWVDGAGRAHQLDTMDPNHRANLIPFLRRNAVAFAMAHAPQVLPQVFSPADRYDQRDLEAAAQEWLAGTPLMVRLCELEAGRSIDERRSTHERNMASGIEKITIAVKRHAVDCLDHLAAPCDCLTLGDPDDDDPRIWAGTEW